MTEYDELKKKIKGLSWKMAIGFVIGFFLGMWTMDNSILAGIGYGLLFTGVPIAYMAVPFTALSLPAWGVKLVIAVFVGCFGAPFFWIYLIVKIVKLKKMEKEDFS